MLEKRQLKNLPSNWDTRIQVIEFGGAQSNFFVLLLKKVEKYFATLQQQRYLNLVVLNVVFILQNLRV